MHSMGGVVGGDESGGGGGEKGDGGSGMGEGGGGPGGLSFQAPAYFYGNLCTLFAHPVQAEQKLSLSPELTFVFCISAPTANFCRPACLKNHLHAAGLTMGQNRGQIIYRRNIDETRPNLSVCEWLRYSLLISPVPTQYPACPSRARGS